MKHTIAALAVFLGFVVGGLLLTRPRGAFGLRRKDSVNLFLVYVLGVSCAIGLVQRTSLFPFHMWTLFGPPAPDSLTATRWMAVDRLGAEHPIDFRAWQPISYWELGLWFDLRFERLSPAEQIGAARFLLEVAENARANARAGAGVGNFRRVLGPAAIPLFHAYRRIWIDSTDVPSSPFAGLRWYRDTWDSATWSDPQRVWRPDAPNRVLYYEYPPRP